MELLSITSLLLVVLCASNVKASNYQECTVYAEGEKKSTYLECRFCVRNRADRSDYCREYTCARAYCDSPVKGENDCCASCPGTCNYGGRIYNVGDVFLCLDGSNYCICMGTGLIRSTLMGYSHETVCKPRHYGACTLYAQWENKDRFRQNVDCLTQTFNGRRVVACKEYTCGHTRWKCDDGVLANNTYDNCNSCPGTCNYAGRTYLVNATFTCNDGANRCFCAGTGHVCLTRMSSNIELMCKTYGDHCVVYSQSEQMDPTKQRYCQPDFLTTWPQYCIEYTCAETTCESPVKEEYASCASCPDTCNYGGKVYNKGDSWTCIDGVNYCRCFGTGAFWHTLMAGSKDMFCFNKQE